MVSFCELTIDSIIPSFFIALFIEENVSNILKHLSSITETLNNSNKNKKPLSKLPTHIRF